MSRLGEGLGSFFCDSATASRATECTKAYCVAVSQVFVEPRFSRNFFNAWAPNAPSETPL